MIYCTFASSTSSAEFVEHLVHHPRGARGGFARAGAMALAIEFIDDALDQRLVDMRRVVNCDLVSLCSTRQANRHRRVSREADAAVRADDFVILLLEVGGKT